MTRTGPLRAGVVGVGHLGRHHARLYASLPGSILVGVVDHDGEKAARVAREHGVRVFPDGASLASEIDVASVAVPTRDHEREAVPMIDAGVATLVEKPIAPDLDSGRRLVERAARRGVPFMVGHTERFHPAISLLRGQLTRPRYLEVHRLAPFTPRSLDVDVVLDLMIHDLDMCRFLLGPVEATLLDAAGAAALSDKIDIATARVKFAGGATANLTASRISPERMRRIRAFESGAAFACDTGEGTLSVYRVHRNDDDRSPEIRREVLQAPGEEPLARELSQFLAAVAAGNAMPCRGEDGLAALELAISVRELIERTLDQ